ncbi:MAG: hypothetical protein J7L74_01470 [Candidatus Hydrothermae bacterium]|nr:hypothetical protein [Candidatus Hydrothermae bacterium]
MKRIYLLLGLFLFSCSRGGRVDYFPLQLGNRWTYQLYSMQKGWKTAKRYVDSKAEIKGMQVYRLKNTFFPDYFLVSDSTGVRAYGADMKTRGRDFVDNSIVVYSEPDTWLLYPLEVGKKWGGSYYFEKDIKKDGKLRTEVKYQVSVLDKGTVQAGKRKYKNSYKVRYREIITLMLIDSSGVHADVDTSEYTVWYAPRVGPVVIEGFGYLEDFVRGNPELEKIRDSGSQ